MKDLRCMSFTSKGTSEILVAGCQEVMFKIDVEKGRIIEEVLGRQLCILRHLLIVFRFLPRRTIL